MPVNNFDMRNPGSSFLIGTAGDPTTASAGLNLAAVIAKELSDRSIGVPEAERRRRVKSALETCTALAEMGGLGPTNAQTVVAASWAKESQSSEGRTRGQYVSAPSGPLPFRPSLFVPGGGSIGSLELSHLRNLHNLIIAPICRLIGCQEYLVTEGLSPRNPAHRQGLGARVSFVGNKTGLAVDAARRVRFGMLCVFESELFITTPLTTREGWLIEHLELVKDEYGEID